MKKLIACLFGLILSMPAMALPSGYTEVEYVSNNSTTKVNTGIVPNVDDIEMEILVKPTSGSWYIFQSRNENSAIYGISGSSTNNTIGFGWSGSSSVIPSSTITRDPSHIYYIKATAKNGTATFYVRDETAKTEDTKTANYTYVATNLPMYLFGNQRGDYVAQGNQVYYAKLKVGGELKMDYVPAKQGNTVGFYDRVSGDFKTAESGSLTASNTELDPCRNLYGGTYYSIAVASSTAYAPVAISGDTWTTDGARRGIAKIIPVSGNTKYTFSTNGYTGANYLILSEYASIEDMTSQANSLAGNGGASNIRKVTITTKANTRYLLAGVWAYPTPAAGTVISITEPQLEQGDTATRYTPYDSSCHTVANSGPISSVTVYGLTELNGTPTPTTPATIQTNNGVLKAYTNLVTNTFQGNIDASGKITSTTATWYINIVPVTPGATYTGSPVKVYAFYTTLPTISSVSYNNSRVVIADQGTQTITVPNDPTIQYLAFRSDSEPAAVCVLGNDISNLNKTYTDGTQETITDSANHTANVATLLGIGDYKDTQVIGTGAITRNVGIKVLDGTESWTTASGSNFTRFNTTDVTAAVGGNSSVGYCTHYPIIYGNVAGQAYFSSTNQSLQIVETLGTTMEQFKQYLAEQYAAGTPVIVVYPLASSTTESVTAQTLSTAPVSNATGGVSGMTIRTVLTSGAEIIETVRNKIKIATNAFNAARFSPVVTALNTAISTIKTVVANTIAQTTAIGNLQSGKQTKPADAACPDYKQCLLVEDSSGVPHWYVISDPFRDFVAPILANNVNATSSTSQNGVPNTYTQVEYIESTGTQYIDTGLSIGCFVHDIAFTTRNTNNLMGISTGGGSYWGQSRSNVDGYENLTYHINMDSSVRRVIEFCATATGSALTVEGETFQASRSTTTGIKYNIFRINGSNQYYTSTKLWGFKAYDENNVLVQDLVPVKKTVNGQTVVGMYDTVTGNFLTNSGTGDFVAGPTVPNQKAEWSATWAAGNNNGVVAGTVYGTTNCNGMTGTLSNNIATAEQMASNNWSTYGTACWCKASGVIVDGERTDKTNDVYYRVSTSGNCAVICPGYCAGYAKTNNGVRQAIFGQ